MSLTTRQGAIATRAMSPATSIGCLSDGFVGTDRRSGGFIHRTTNVISLAYRIGDPATKGSENSHCAFS